MTDESAANPTLEARVAALERRVRALVLMLALALAAYILAFAAQGAARVPEAQAATPPHGPDSLRLRSLVIEDANGKERVRLGAPLPDPLILGRRVPRGGAVSGVLLFDAEGNERTGYVTSDGFPNVFFTLDDIARQRVLFLTEPQGATSFWMWGPNGDALKLGANEERARVRIERGQTVLFEAPDSALAAGGRP